MSRRVEKVPDDVFVNDAYKIVEKSEKHGIVLRVMGAVAIGIHSKGFADLYKKLSRLGEEDQVFSDIDFMGYSKQRGKLRDFLEKELGYLIDRHIMVYFGKIRHIYYHPKGWYSIDVFFDKLQFSHDIYFGPEPGKGRLELDYPTITLADLLLEKTQIHDINEKDLKDLIVLLRAHEIGDKDEKEIVNGKYIATVLADDWGFWYDAKRNLGKVKAFTEKYRREGLLTENDLIDVMDKIARMNKYIDEEPKTKNWNKRAKNGVRKTWWRKVEEVMR